MRLGYFTMPLHLIERNALETLQEDREAIILAGKLGFYDAFVGEHLTDLAENVTNSFIFLATLIGETKHIKLGTGTSNLSHSHPTLVAAHAAMFDHLAKGRFIFGISPGALASDAEALGILDQDRNKMFAEAIDVILEIWSRDAPYDIDLPNNRYKVSTAKTAVMEIGRGGMYKPYQQPRPEIVGTVVAPFSKGVIAMGQRDFHPVNQVVDQVLALREEIGDFGELVYAGMDFVDRKLGERSMQLMAEQVMPRVNEAIRGRSAAA